MEKWVLPIDVGKLIINGTRLIFAIVLNKNYKQSKYYNYEKNVFDFGDGGKCYDVIV